MYAAVMQTEVSSVEQQIMFVLQNVDWLFNDYELLYQMGYQIASNISLGMLLYNPVL